MNRLAVVIPLYNHAQYISQAVESALNQSRRPDRILIIDDGSTDNSLEVARKFTGPGVEVHSQENRGAHATLNRCIEMAADCEYCAILNSDDFYLPGRLEACTNILDSNPGTDLVCTGLRIVGGDGAALGPDEPRSKWFAATWSLRQSGLSTAGQLGVANFPATTSNFVARRDWLLRHPFKPYRYAHDYFALLLAALEDRLHILDTPLLAYRVHATNTISTSPRNLVLEMLRLYADFARETAPLLDSPEARRRYAEIMSASWSNVSAFVPALFAAIQAQALDALPPDRLNAFLAKAAEYPEADKIANRPLLQKDAEGRPLLDIAALSSRLDSLQEEVRKLKEDRDALSALQKLRASAARSRWTSFKRAFGFGPNLSVDEGKTPQEKLQRLRRELGKNA
jgi:glycosyltransferase involved in cell wall biosynthesis